MKTKKALSKKGFVLIEALVAIVVVMVGALGIIKLNAVLLGGTGVTKTQAEALQIAQQRIEIMRNYVLSTGCLDSTTVGSTVAGLTNLTGTNASFRVDTVVSAGTVDADKVINTCVAWDGSSNACTAAPDKRVILKSSLACSGVGTSGLVNEASSGGTGIRLKTPTGAARVGGNSQTNLTLSTANVLFGSSTLDGTRTGRTGPGSTGGYVLLDSAGNALLTIDNEADGGFSTISGRVYIETNNSGTAIVDPQGPTMDESDDTVFVLSSDASYCARVFPTFPVPSSGTAKYRYFDYNCYVSKGWWGNIGVVRLDNPNANNRVCLGDMGVTSTETSIWSRKANLSISRGYRAYKKINPSGSDTDQANFDTVGIGFSLQSDGTFSDTYEAVNLGASRDDPHHDFLVTAITGQGTCESSGNMKLVTGDTDGSNQFTSNLGRYYCMSGQCPDLTVGNTVQTTVIYGTITKATGAVLTGIDPADCQIGPTTLGTDSSGNYTYSCTKTWTGFAGSSWQGGVTFLTPTGNATTVCANSSNSPPAVLPTGYNVTSTINDKDAAVNANSISFTDVTLGVTSIIIDLNAEASSCNRLGTPALTWATGQKPHNLTWSAITGANSYMVYSCTGSTASDCIIPTTANPEFTTTTTVAPNFSAPSAAGDTTICYKVVTDTNGGIGASTASATKCMTQTVVSKTTGSGTTYTSSYAER